MTFYIGGTDTSSGTPFRIEFQHINRHTRHGRKRLAHFSGFDEMTTCVVTEGIHQSIYTTFCSTADYANQDPALRFTYERARELALKGALAKCKPWRKLIPQVLAAYHARRVRAAVSLFERAAADIERAGVYGDPQVST